ncbi:MAG: hypothetical protein GX638_10045 [Crenarchaeota archaeon]|nr:hypothetical protein [Thermoproteota archaeon]
MVKSATEKSLSTNFLYAHGIPKEAGWSALTKDNQLVVIKLVKVSKIMGLKSH